MGVVGLWLPNVHCVLHVAQRGCAAASSLWEGRLILRLNNFLRAPSIHTREQEFVKTNDITTHTGNAIAALPLCESSYALES